MEENKSDEEHIEGGEHTEGDKPTDEQMKAAEAQFDKLSPTELIRLGKRVGMMLTAGGVRQGLTTMIAMQKTIRELQKLSKKAKKAEAKGDFEGAKHYGEEMLKILDAQKNKLLGPDVSLMLSAIEADVRKSMANLDAKKV